MKKITEAIRQQHLQEQGQIAAELYHLRKRCDELEDRLRELDVIFATTKAIDDETEKAEQKDD